MNVEDLLALVQKMQQESKALLQEKAQLLHENEEKDKIIEEKDRTIYAVKEENFSGWILKKGLPPLPVGPRDSTAPVSQQKKIQFELEEASEFGYLFDLEGVNQKQMAGSFAWKRRNIEHSWENEASIQVWVRSVIDDCIESIPELSKKIYTKPEIGFPGLQKNERNVVDFAVVTNRAISSAIGAIEVKKPPNDTQASHGAALNFDDAGQLVQYLHDLRACYGVRFVFGIYTNYTQWCFYWFKDSDLAAKESSLDDYLKMCVTSPNQEQRKAVIPKNLIICRSKIFNYDDKDLVLAIRSMVLKWAYSPCDRVGGLLAKNRLYQSTKAGERESAFEKLPSELKCFSYVFEFHSNTKIFYFLAVYHRTGDGVAALYTTSGGNIGVAKFRIPSQNGQNMKKAANQEAQLWYKIWDVKAKVLFMADKYAVFMPFAFHFRWYETGVILCPLSSWNHSNGLESDFFDSKLVKEDKFLGKCEVLKTYRNNPLKAAEEALRKMIDKGYCQPDDEVAWRHVALLPERVSKSKKRKVWVVRPIIIDLARVMLIEDGKKEETFNRQLRILKNSLPNAAD